MILKIILLLIAAAIAWWLSGVDLQNADEDRRRNLIRRILRCLATIFFAVCLFGINAIGVGYLFIPVLLVAPISIALIWRAPLADLFTRGFLGLVDSDDKREFDPHKGARAQDMVASLLKYGRHEEAVQLCDTLKESGDANVLVLETLLARHGIHSGTTKPPGALTLAHQARAAGNFDEAERILVAALAGNPVNLSAALALMRLYVCDLRRSDKAAEVLKSLKRQTEIPAAQIEYAERSINDWAEESSGSAPVPLPETTEELLAGGFFGSAIESLERKIKERPDDFDLWLKLIEAHALHVGDTRRAEIIVEQLKVKSSITAAQIEIAKGKLREWREAKTQGK
jgi:tetratricopeptide (TPR) repeat protein